MWGPCVSYLGAGIFNCVCSTHQYKDAFYSNPKDKPNTNYVFGGVEFNVPSSSTKHLAPFNTQPSRQVLLDRCIAGPATPGPPLTLPQSQPGARAALAESQAYAMQVSQRLDGTQEDHACNIARHPVATLAKRKGHAPVNLRLPWQGQRSELAWERLGLPRISFMPGHMRVAVASLPVLVRAHCREHLPHWCTRRVITLAKAPPSLQSVKQWLRKERATNRSDAKRKSAAAAAAANKLSHKFDSNCGRLLPVGSGRVAFSQPLEPSTQASRDTDGDAGTAPSTSNDNVGEQVAAPPATFETQTGSAETPGLPTPDTSGKTAGAQPM